MGRAPPEIHPDGFTGNVDADRTGSWWPETVSKRTDPMRLLPPPLVGHGCWGNWNQCPTPWTKDLWSARSFSTSLLPQPRESPDTSLASGPSSQSPSLPPPPPGHKLSWPGVTFSVHFQHPSNTRQNLNPAALLSHVFPFQALSSRGSIPASPREQKVLFPLFVLGGAKLNLKQSNRDTALFNETYLSLPVGAPPEACSVTSQQLSSRRTSYFSPKPQRKESL